VLRELAVAGRENLVVEHVRRYDAKEDARADDEVAYLRGHGLDDMSTVVDLGAGTGQFTISASRVAQRVVAVDVSPAMLSHLRDKVAEAGCCNVDVVEAGFVTYEHQGPAPDIVYSRYALHHLPDFWKGMALQRIHDLLRPGGRFRLWDVVYHFDPREAPARIEAWCATGGDDVSAEWLREELEEHVRDEHSTYTWALEAMATRVGFRLVEASYSDDGFFAQYLFQRP
jgi:SAM-dependent methyltransferase